jgi:hypothetical protein
VQVTRASAMPPNTTKRMGFIRSLSRCVAGRYGDCGLRERRDDH